MKSNLYDNRFDWIESEEYEWDYSCLLKSSLSLFKRNGNNSEYIMKMRVESIEWVWVWVWTCITHFKWNWMNSYLLIEMKLNMVIWTSSSLTHLIWDSWYL